MQTFTYKVRDAGGKVSEGSLEADSQALVTNKLRQMGLVPISINQKASAGMNKELKIPGFGPKVKLKDLVIFSRQFATMINAGLSLLRALAILGEQTSNKALAKTINQARLDVESGSSLSQALSRHPKVFNQLYVAMIRAGETAGAMDSVMLQLADILEKQNELRGKVKSAMTYPAVVLGLVLIILTAMLVFVVPMFASMYDSLGGKLPLMTRVLMVASAWTVKLFPFLIVFDILAVWAFKRWIQTEGGRASWDTFKLKVPVFGQLAHKTALTRFARTLSVLLRAGVPILEALDITSETVGNTVVSRAIKDTQQGVKGGETIAAPLARHAVFPPMVVQMMAVGEETGGLDEMLEKVSDFYDQEVEATVNALTSLLEPMLIVVLGGAVGGMVISLYLPMFNVINLVK